MQRSRDWRRAQWQRHYNKRVDRVVNGGRRGYWKANRGELEQVWRWFHYGRRNWARLDGYDEVDYNRRQWKADTARMIQEQERAEQ